MFDNFLVDNFKKSDNDSKEADGSVDIVNGMRTHLRSCTQGTRHHSWAWETSLLKAAAKPLHQDWGQFWAKVLEGNYRDFVRTSSLRTGKALEA